MSVLHNILFKPLGLLILGDYNIHFAKKSIKLRIEDAEEKDSVIG